MKTTHTTTHSNHIQPIENYIQPHTSEEREEEVFSTPNAAKQD